MAKLSSAQIAMIMDMVEMVKNIVKAQQGATSPELDEVNTKLDKHVTVLNEEE